jgi:hypothetical protein
MAFVDISLPLQAEALVLVEPLGYEIDLKVPIQRGAACEESLTHPLLPQLFSGSVMQSGMADLGHKASATAS